VGDRRAMLGECPITNAASLAAGCRAGAVFSLALLLAVVTAGCSPEAGPPDPFSGQVLYDDIVTYCTFGDHRTASPEDLHASRWLQDQLAAAGLQTDRVPFTVEQFLIDQQQVTVAGGVIDAYPLWIPRATGPDGVEGTLRVVERPPPSADSLAGVIPLVRIESVRDRSVPIIDAVAAAGAPAVLAVAPDPSGEIVVWNTRRRMPLPVMLVAPKDEAALRAAADRSARASVLLDGRLEERAEAFDVIGRIDGPGPLMVVSTPYSAWTLAAGERGPGVAYFLALARWAGLRRTDARWLFVATSGHELSDAGVRAFLDHAPPPAAVACWLHLGAAISVYEFEETPTGMERRDRAWTGTRLLTNSEPFLPILEEAFAPVVRLQPQLATSAGGTLRLLFGRGYSAFGFEGGFPYAHTPMDVPAVTTGPDILEPIGRALLAAVQEIIAKAAPPGGHGARGGRI